MTLKTPFNKKRLKPGETKTAGNLILRKAVNVSNIFHVPSIKTYTEGFTQDAAITPDFIQETISSIDPKFKYVGTEVIVNIWNRSGVNDDYSWELTNVTQATTLASETNYAIVDKGYNAWAFIFGKNKVAVGDVLKFNVSAGVVGTAAGQAQNGQIGFIRSYLVKSISLNNWLGTSQ